MKQVCLSFDIEDWFQVENLREVFPPETWDKAELRVERNTRQILDILDEKNIKATFFVLGWIAERVPGLVKEIVSRGHEVASHGYNHQLNYNLDSDALRKDLENSKKLLEDITGIEVMGYRAPTFSISDEVMTMLKELGYKYDSSLNDFPLHDRYGKLSGEKSVGPFLHSSGIVEIPMPLVSIFNKRIPISGGGYFRLLPFGVFRNLVIRFLKENNLYVFYMHPWEIDDEQPRVKDIKLTNTVRQYTALAKTERRLRTLVDEIKKRNNARFERLGQLLTSSVKQEETGGAQ
ncbi:MAG: XrtA system polysaccharide deacetylase [Mesotoga sp.]